MKKRSPLVAKFVIGFLIIGIAICAVTTARGYSQYKSYIEKKYNNIAYDIAEIFESYMTEEQLALYLNTTEGYFQGTVSEEELVQLKESEEYGKVEELLHSLREATEANDIFMVYSNPEVILSYDETDAENWQPLTYIFDCYMVEELKFDLGHKGGFNPAFIESIVEVLETGKRVDNYFISESDFGYNTSAVYPVMVDGVVKGIIGVEIPMATLETALQEYIVNAVERGADEIDMVINIGDLKAKKYGAILEEIKAIKAACADKILKVIIETCLLTDEEKIKMCEIVTEAGADYIKTSTGFSTAGATKEDVALFAKHVGKNVLIKAAGGIASLKDAEDFISLGASRLGTSRVVKIAKNESSSSNY